MKAILVSSILWTTALVLTLGACTDTNTAPRVAILADTLFPNTPPQVLEVTISPSTVAPGDAFTVAYKAISGRPITYSEVTYEPAPDVRFVRRNEGLGTHFVWENTSVPVMAHPTGAASSTVDLIKAHLSILVADSSGRMATLAGNYFTTGGSFTGAVQGPVPAVCHSPAISEKCGWQTAVVGETLRVTIEAQSTAGVAWVGYLIGSPFNTGDSSAVSGMAASKTYEIPLTSAWILNIHYGPDISLFYRDQYERRFRTITGTLNTAYVVQGPRRPYALAPLPGLAQDMVLDTLRGVLYVSQPDSNRILRLSAATMTYGTAIPMAGQPYGLDLTLSGDSLLVGLYKSQELGIVNLQTGSVSMVPLVGLGLGGGFVGPQYVKEAANGKVLIGVLSGYFGYQYVWEYDLNTGQQGRRLDATNHVGPIVAIGSRSRLALQSQIYVATSDSLTPPVSHPYFTAAQPSSDANGQYILVGKQLFTSDYTPVRTYVARWGPGGAAAIAPDASRAFFPGPGGYHAVRVADGALTEEVPVAETPVLDRLFFKLLPSPDGQTLFGLGWYSVARIDLRPLTPAPRH